VTISAKFQSRKLHAAIIHASIFLTGVGVGTILAYLATPEQKLHSSIVHIDYLKSLDDLDGTMFSTRTDTIGNQLVGFTGSSLLVLQEDSIAIGVNSCSGFVKQNRLDSLPDWINSNLNCRPIWSETHMDVEFQIKWDVFKHRLQLGDNGARVVRLPIAPSQHGEKYFAVIYQIRIR
jgi:hypothetical protein